MILKVRLALMVALSALVFVISGCDGDSNNTDVGTDDGATQVDGLASLVNLTAEDAGANCAEGGQKIESGLDDNGDGLLDAAEVDSTNYFCNDGPEASLAALVNVVEELAGANCPFGGQAIETGYDANADGVLDASEVDATSYVCDGTASSLVVVGAEPAGVNCPFGGQAIETGYDTNADGVLDASEVDATSYVCDDEDLVVAVTSDNCVVCHGGTNDVAVGPAHLIKEYSHPAADVEYTGTISDVVIAGGGELQVTFSIRDNHDYFVEVGMFEDAGPLNARGIRFYLAKLDPATNNWYRVVYERGTEGTSFVDNGDGSYTFTSAAIVTAGFTDATYPAMDAPYDANATYRAGLAFGGHGGPADSPTYDFRPVDGETDVTIIETRNIVANATCVKCHGNEFHGHGGDRKTMENCVMCHNPTALSNDLDNNLKDGEMDSSDMAVMIHNIHNGTEDYWVYRTRSGGNWYNWGENLAGDPRATHTMTFPQPSYACVACHESDTAVMVDGLNWQQNPTINDCGDSCHTDIDFTAAHMGAVRTDADCAGCHDGADILAKHSTANTDIISAADLALDTPEYTVAVTMLDESDVALTATDDITDMAAKVEIVISDDAGVIDHTTITAFDHVNLFVYGPRSRMNPVLTTAAAAGGMGYYANNDLATDTKATITAGSIVYQLDTATGLTAGTYAAYVDVCNVKGDETAGYQAASVAKANFQIGPDAEDQIAGNCQSCHGDTMMHSGKANSHRHDTLFDNEACGACHDYTNGNDTATVYEWFGGVPMSKRIHAVHAAATLIDPDYTIGHAPADPSHEWSHISYPAALNDCAGTCHNPSNSTDTWMSSPNQLACMGCHDTPLASEHMGLMGGVAAP